LFCENVILFYVILKAFLIWRQKSLLFSMKKEMFKKGQQKRLFSPIFGDFLINPSGHPDFDIK
jgi:hypothetical protein